MKYLIFGVIGGIAFNILWRKAMWYIDTNLDDGGKKELLYDSPPNHRCKCNNEICMCSNKKKKVL